MFISILLDIGYCIILILLIPLWIYRICYKGKYRKEFWERLGYLRRFPREKNTIWLHGVSVGEIKAAQPLVKRIQNTLPEHRIIISATSATGRDIARKLFADFQVIPFPFDFSWAVVRYFRHFRPDLVILMELELWPNFLYWARKLNIPVILVNGRLSDRSFQRYHRYLRWLFCRMTAGIHYFCVQTELYAERFHQLGIPWEHIKITGNMKFDAAPVEKAMGKKTELMQLLSITEEVQVFVAGSTHAPEEKILLDCYQYLLRFLPDLRMIIVPRHPERADEISDWVIQRGFTPFRKSSIRESYRLAPGKILIADVMGELVTIYTIATVVFIGGSLIPHGGQNFIEPAALGKPVVCGPYMQNFPDVSFFLKEKALIQLDCPENLNETVKLLLQDKEQREKIGNKAKDIVEKSQGSTEQNLHLCLELLGRK